MFCDVILPFFWLTICQTDETITGYAKRGTAYRLEELADEPVMAAVSLTFPGRKQIELRTPCFVYYGKQRLPYPWFRFEAKGVTAYSCIETLLEKNVLKHVTAATLIEVSNHVLILTDHTGAEMVFRRD